MFRFPFLVFLLVGALAACGPADQVGIQTQFSDSAGVTIAQNPGLPELGAGGWALEQSPNLSIGSLDGDPLYEFFGVTGAVWLSDGRIAVTDNGSHQIRVFSPDGTYLAAFGGEGEGPGEFRNIQVMGTIGLDTLVVLDGRQRRTSLFHPEMGFLRVTNLPEEAGVAMHSNGMFGDGSIVFGGLINWDRGDDTPSAGYERLTNPFNAVRLDGSGIIPLGEFPGTEVIWTKGQIDGRETLGAAFVTFGLSPRAMARDGHMALGTRDRYEVNVFGLSGALERIIRVQTPSVAVTEDHLEAYLEEMLARLPSPDLAPQVRASFRERRHAEAMPAFGDIFLDSEGYLWVEDYIIPGNTHRTWTVFDEEGSAKTRLSLPMENRVLDIREDLVLTVFEDELGVEYVRTYPLTRGG